MTQEDKELLLKDLCARLPYGLKVKCEKYSFPVTIFYTGNIDEVKFKETGGIENICAIKPYLFPLSSITKKRLEELSEYIDIKNAYVAVELLNSHHIDYRGLIEKGLAIDATGLDVY